VTARELRHLWYADLYRYGPTTPRDYVRALLAEPGYRYAFAMRLVAYARSNAGLAHRALAIGARIWLRNLRFRYGVDLPAGTRVGSGLYMNHPNGIVVHSDAVIGRDCNLSQDVTLGEANRGRNAGFPTIGDGVYIGPGAKIVGAVHVGDDAAIGANCVVTRDVPPHSVVVGVPGRVISDDGAAGYVNRTDYRPAPGLG
jgi:serine O-acetyltransferase